MKKRLLVLDSEDTVRTVLSQILSDLDITYAVDAQAAIQIAAEKKPDLVLCELSLAAHSGFEFLYEFRSYSDWLKIPVIVFSHIKLSDEIQNSRAWKQLNVLYFYKPRTTLEKLKEQVLQLV
jgi:CheY-like chemotaxis protein